MKPKEILPPFLTAAVVAFVLCVLLELVRPGFVSLFIDFRILAALVLLLWSVSSFSSAQGSKIIAAFISFAVLAGALLLLYVLAAPYGRLGMVVWGAGVLAAIGFLTLSDTA